MHYSPRALEEMYHQCLTEGKSREECIALIEPHINQYADPEGVKYMIQHYRKMRKQYSSSREKGKQILESVKESLKK